MVVLVVLLGHAGIAAWLITHRTRAETPPTPPLVEVALLKPTRIADAPETAAPTRHVTRAEGGAPRSGALRGYVPMRHARPDTGAATSPTARPVSRTAAAETASAGEAASDAADTSAASALPASTADTAAADAKPASTAGSASASHPGEHFALLPSSDLRYDTYFNGAQNQSGTIHWETNGKTYRLVVSLPLPFVGTFNYISQGHIDAFGLAPDSYTEKRGRRPADITSFNRTASNPQVSFTRRPDTIALPDGAQDRFSMIFQLASLVRGDPARYQPGVTREFFVVDSDSGEIWPVQTMGPDRVMRFDGPIDTIHFMRLPRHDGDRRRIDVWLAPSFDWLPVRIMQTEPNGTQVELIYHSGMRTLSPAAQSELNDSSTHENQASQNGAPQAHPTDAGNAAERGPERP